MRRKKNFDSLLREFDSYVGKPDEKSGGKKPAEACAGDELYKLFTKKSQPENEVRENTREPPIRTSSTAQNSKGVSDSLTRCAREQDKDNMIYKKNYLSRYRYIALQQRPSQWSNIFVLLSKFGSDLKECVLVPGNIEGWSSEAHWYFCEISQNGFPWDIGTLSKLKSAAKALLKRNSSFISYHERKQKLLDVQMVQNITCFLETEWNVYEKLRLGTLRCLGLHALEKKTHIMRSKTGDDWLDPSQGLVWKNISCAYDALLSILPHITLCSIDHDVYNTQVLDYNGLCHAPIAMLFAGFELLESSSASAADVSDWIRYLVVDILRRNSSPEGTTLEARNAAWTPFSMNNAFCDIGELIGSMHFFGKPFFDA